MKQGLWNEVTREQKPLGQEGVSHMRNGGSNILAKKRCQGKRGLWGWGLGTKGKLVAG